MVEVLFAHLKRILRLDRLRLRGPSGAKDEFLLPKPSVLVVVAAHGRPRLTRRVIGLPEHASRPLLQRTRLMTTAGHSRSLVVIIATTMQTADSSDRRNT